VSPNEARFCDDFLLDIPHALDFRAGLSYPLPWGITFGATFLQNDEGSLDPTYTFSPTIRYPDGQPFTTATAAGRNINGIFRTERKQIDLKVSKTFRYRSLTIAPTIEVFNVTNQDMVITYVSQSYANPNGTYLRPNSLLQGRIVGWGARVAW
jgi:hypothetical protein